MKAKVRCVGFDPVSKRKIPRSYVYYLETRVRHLEALLDSRGIAYPPPEDDFAISEDIRPGINVPFPIEPDEGDSTSAAAPAAATEENDVQSLRVPLRGTVDPALRQTAPTGRGSGRPDARLDSLVSHDGLTSIRAAPDPRYQPSASGISFARIVMEAVKTSGGGHHAHTNADHRGAGVRASAANARPSSHPTESTNSNMRDSFFGLHTRPTIPGAPFPDRALGERLAQLYFEHANPQIPVLHRDEFQALFARVYAKEPRRRTPRELYLLNIVFAIGAGIINDSAGSSEQNTAAPPVGPTVVAAMESPSDSASVGSGDDGGGAPPSKKRARVAAAAAAAAAASSQQHQPEEYHAAAIVHLENFLGCPPATEGVSGGLEELQAVLLLAGLALLRPVAPGLWYIIGVAVRLSIDLGLHFEDIEPELDEGWVSDDEEEKLGERADKKKRDKSAKAKAHFGRRQWTRDLRRRLWWCVYSESSSAFRAHIV